jgi:hypothetical protein
VLSSVFAGKRNGFIAGLLVMALCLPPCPIALAASVPSAPEGFTAVAGNGKVALVWFEPEDDGGAAIMGYRVSMDGGATWIDVGLATSYTFDGLTGGIVYTFLVRAVNGAGYGEEAIANAKPKDSAEATPAPTDGLGSLFDAWFGVTPEPDDANANGHQTGQGQVITGGGGGIIAEPPPEEEPPVTPPPRKETPEDPQPEDNIPIEIDPAEVTERPFRVVKPKIMDLAGTYTIVASGTQSAGDKVPTPNTPCRFDCILDFKATRVGGTISGDYTGVGSFNMIMDSAFYAAAMPNFTWEFAEGGPLTNITFTLYPSLTPLPPLQPAGNSGSSLTPLPPLQPADNSGSSLQPLPPLQPAGNSGSGLQPLPPLKPRPPAQAIGNGTMYWNASIIQDHHVWLQNGDTSQPYLSYGPTSLAFNVILYANGSGIVTITLYNWRLTYKARLVKGVTLVDVK